MSPTRVNTSTTQVSKNQHESNTSQQKLGTSQFEPKKSLDHEKKNKYG